MVTFSIDCDQLAFGYQDDECVSTLEAYNAVNCALAFLNRIDPTFVIFITIGNDYKLEGRADACAIMLMESFHAGEF